MERLTVMYDGLKVPKKACTFDREGYPDDCKACDGICQDAGGVCGKCILQECLTKLGDYEDIGLTPEQIRELKERDTAALLGKIMDGKKKGYLRFGTCPKCKRRVTDVEGGNFCQNCGQRIKWEE